MRDDDDLSLDHLPNVPHVDIQSALSMGDYSLLKPARAEPLAVPPVPLEAMVSAEPVLTQQAEPAMAPEPEPEPEPGAQPEIEFVEHYESVEFIEAFAETDEPVESLLLFTDSYEVIEPAPEDEDKPGDRTDSEWDDLR
jgi:hypothetical protein